MRGPVLVSITTSTTLSGPVAHPKGHAGADTLGLLVFVLVFAALLFLFYGRRFMRRGAASST
jgi:hypothetical protein